MSVKRFCAGVGVAAAVASGLVVGASPASADPAGCPSMYVVAIPGTWETSSGAAPKPGMLTDVTDRLGGDIRTEYVSYPATAFPWEGEVYGQSRAAAVTNAGGMLKAMADRCGATKLGIIGYSQGADAAGDLAASIGTGLGVVPADKVVAVGLVSDPKRSDTDALVGPPVVGTGVGGPRVGGFGYVSPVVRTFCAVGDLYCSTPKDDYVARLAGFLAVSSNPAPDVADQYTQEAQSLIADLAASGGLPVLQGQLSDQANAQRQREIEAFYRSGIHQEYQTYDVGDGVSATRWLARYLADAV
ncbi:cutinase [Rhodococcoides fascians]|uniref:cutinase family protein n=1 Tax=Rhodococcoides fascians TaxID=1828 RepID=UPI000B9AB984|nr:MULTISPECIES: cutinase family protein [Rhodococcus]MBY4209291.1 cutinase family protein [Rhodococcus fascians]MCX6490475.1 cutinase family protein [Rhodococcus sp. (in: high G+C Gram-positive bacteria)]MDJ0470237.1 cutinase family protein [Rhodococcus fascians]OZE89467.1 cutinase [Rhodococcus fascians]OZF17775.1 cutinase [Rhodococcus fascians]